MFKEITKKDLKKINDYLWEIPKSFRPDMRVPARIYADEKLLSQIFGDESLHQLVNTTTLPGIVKYSLAMPDAHEGYGFCIGGVAATDYEKGGVISPGGVGFDISCSVRLLTSGFNFEEVKPHLEKLADELNRAIPSGVGRGGKIKLDRDAMNKVLAGGLKALVPKGYATEEDMAHCEANGSLEGADPTKVSNRAKKRGSDQLGTLGSGNHFCELQKVDKIFDQEVATKFGLELNQVVIMIHTGSRGLGHQVCTDWLRIMNAKIPGWGIKLPDRELACAPINTPEGKGYFGAMYAAANFAVCNHQMITCLVRKVWDKIFGKKSQGLKLLYSIAHNIAKIEEHEIDGKKIKLVVHRKGATRAFPPGHPELLDDYKETGQPVLIPGSMGTASHVLAGTKKGKESFFSVCHGAGRTMSRRQAKRQVWGSDLIKQLAEKGIIIKCSSPAGIAEEAPIAYKDVDRVVEVVAKAGLAKKVARVIPLAVIKGE